MNDFLEAYLSLVFLVLAFMLLIAGLVLVPILAIVGSPLLLTISVLTSPQFQEARAESHSKSLLRKAKRVAPELDSKEDLFGLMPYHLDSDIADLAVEIGEDMLLLTEEGIPEAPNVYNSIEGARYRDKLIKIANGDGHASDATQVVARSMGILLDHVPEGSARTTTSIRNIVNTHKIVERMIGAFWGDDADGCQIYRDIFNENLERAGGVLPSKYKEDDVVERYLADTPLVQLFDIQVPIDIRANPFEHTFMLAGTGHGKTSVIQYLIAEDLEEICEGEKSVVVIDSQRELITDLMAIDFPADRMVVIDPEDIDFPVLLNLFAAGRERFDQYSGIEREQLESSIISLLEFVLSSIMGTTLTGQQQIIFRYTIRLVLLVPDATLETFLHILEQPKGLPDYQEYLQQLDRISRNFFEQQFDDNEFSRMRKAVIRRLYLIMENRTFMRMFSLPESRFDMFTEINEGKLILVNTSLATLKEEASQTFGRFFIALLAQAAEERALISRHERTPCHVYIDEAQEYLDPNIDRLLAQARKQKIGVTMATQYLRKLDRLKDAIAANTNTKLAGGVSAADARAFASDMRTSAELIQELPVLTFAAYVKGVTDRAVPIKFPPGTLSHLPQRQDREEMLAYQRGLYSLPPAIPSPESEQDELVPEDVEPPPKPPEEDVSYEL